MSTPSPPPDAAPVLEQDYRGAGFGHALVPGNSPALVLVDPVRAYTDPTSPLYAGVERPVEAMRAVLAAARAARVPVVITRVSYDAQGTQGGVFRRKVPALDVFVEGSPLGAFIDGLDPADGELVLTKHYPSAFFATGLAGHLRSLGVDTVLVAGLSTSGCVRGTAVDAMQHGFVPVVVEDAVGDRDPRVHEANLFDLRHKTGEVWPLPAVTAYLAEHAAAPHEEADA